jgi:meso-butanediol dehydrogenase/(S,S)-butanediol dehydrogenase/diacetyl reductase
MARLLNKTALITGGGAGIGAACGLLFCTEGATVILVDVDGEALERTGAQIRKQVPGAKVATVTANVAGDAQKVIDFCLESHGKLDVLVNNAAMRNYASVANATVEEWQAVVNVNLIGTASYSRAALPLLRRSASGSIVNVSSCYAVTGRKGMGIYDATKAAQLALTRTLAHEEAMHGVRVNAVCPGSTLTDFHVAKAEAIGKSVEQLKTERQDTSLLGRWATPMEIAYPILWLASPEASFITGATLMADGGLSAM